MADKSKDTTKESKRNEGRFADTSPEVSATGISPEAQQRAEAQAELLVLAREEQKENTIATSPGRTSLPPTEQSTQLKAEDFEESAKIFEGTQSEKDRHDGTLSIEQRRTAQARKREVIRASAAIPVQTQIQTQLREAGLG